MRRLVLMVGVSLALLACRGPKHPRPIDDCRAIALHGGALIDASPASERDDAGRLFYNLIDLCQSPGLAASTKTCVLGAATITAVRGCPALTEVVGDATGDDGAPSCHAAIDHAMRLLEADSSRPKTRDAREEARSAYLDGCAELAPSGRQCVVDATTIAAVDDCFADPALTTSPTP